MPEKIIPDIVVGRLPIYLRALQRMLEENRRVTSSQELGERLGISAAQIRKDLSQFGEFGKQGTGYSIEFLADQIKKILHVDQVWDMAVIAKVGSQVGPFTVKDIKTIKDSVREAGIKVAMIATPSQTAQEVAEELVSSGVRAILNYAPINLNVPEDVKVQYIDPVIHLQRMTYYL
jgi:redox-sensing transcriptional repressor